MYASGITYTAVSAASSGSGVLTGADNGLSVSTVTPGTAVLGQDIGQAGNPAALLSEREVPMSGVGINFLSSGTGYARLSSVGGAEGILYLYKGSNGQQPAEIVTQQGQNPAPGAPFGNFWVTLDETFVNPDGQDDAVLQWGYNQDGTGGRKNINEAEIHWAIESHFVNGGQPTFEVHLEYTAINTAKNRIFSCHVNKNVGGGSSFWTIDQMVWFTTNTNTNPYMTITNAGELEVVGAAAKFEVFNSNPTWGQWSMVTNNDGSVGITNASTGGNAVFSFGQKIQITTTVGTSSLEMIPLNNGAGILQQGASGTGAYNALFCQASFDSGIGIAVENTSTAAGAFALHFLRAAGVVNANNSCFIGMQNTDASLLGKDWYFGQYALDGTMRWCSNNGGFLNNGTAMILSNAGGLTVTDTLTTADPGSGAGSWKLGTVQAAAAVLDGAHYVEVQIQGVVVKLAVIT